MTRPKKDWALTPEAFERLLEVLGEDRGEGAREYERIRGRLTRFFEWRGAGVPEELVDRTLDRVARRIEEGVEIRSQDPYAFIVGVGNFIFKEHLRQRYKEEAALNELPHTVEGSPSLHPLEPADDEGSAELLGVLESCLGELSAAQRRLLLDYHRGERGERIRNRRALAAELGLSSDNLRLRAHRLRKAVERCIAERRGKP